MKPNLLFAVEKLTELELFLEETADYTTVLTETGGTAIFKRRKFQSNPVDICFKADKRYRH